jgi:hypothetical protein
MIRTRLHLKPGQRGAKKLTRQYGDKLVAVRYLYDAEAKKRHTTVELVVETVDWEPKEGTPGPTTLVGVRVSYPEAKLKDRIKAAGGKWDPLQKLWVIPYGKAAALKLHGRLVNLTTGESI